MNHTDINWTESHQHNSEPDFYGKWTKCDDEMPKSGAWYLAVLAVSDGQVEVLFYDGENEHGIHWLQNGDWEFPVTDWSILPEIPGE